MNKSTISTSLLLFMCSIFMLTTSGSALTKKKFDFVIGKDGDFKAAMSAASKAGGKRFIIFFPNGDYNIGTLTGDSNQKTIFKPGNVSFIGQDNAKTLIYNKSSKEGIPYTATLALEGNNTYLQDITFQNKAAVGSGRNVVIDERCQYTIYKNIRFLSGQDTYYTRGAKTYWEGGEIQGTVDFICGGGDIFFNEVLLWTLKPSAMVAPADKPVWGYIFNKCTVDGLKDGYTYGRNWNEGKMVFLNTVMKKAINPVGWSNGISGRTNQLLLAEYNSVTADGKKVDTSKRKIGKVLSESEAANFTIENVHGSWNPQQYTKQVPAPKASAGGSTLRWNDDENALCWVVFKDNTYFKCVTEPSCAISSGDDAKKYTIRAANAMGGLGPIASVEPSEISMSKNIPRVYAISCYTIHRKILTVQTGTSKQLHVNIFSLNGKKALSKEFCIKNKASKVEIPLNGIRSGLYLIKTEHDGVVMIDYINIR